MEQGIAGYPWHTFFWNYLHPAMILLALADRLCSTDHSLLQLRYLYAMQISTGVKFRPNQLGECVICNRGKREQTGQAALDLVTNFVGDMTSKQNRRSESLTGRTVHIRRSSSITVGTSPSPLFLQTKRFNSPHIINPPHIVRVSFLFCRVRFPGGSFSLTCKLIDCRIDRTTFDSTFWILSMYVWISNPRFALAVEYYRFEFPICRQQSCWRTCGDFASFSPKLLTRRACRLSKRKTFIGKSIWMQQTIIWWKITSSESPLKNCSKSLHKSEPWW